MAAVAVTEMMFVVPTSAALTLGMLPNCRATAALTGALVTSCSSVSTSVGVICSGLPLAVTTALSGWNRSCAEAEYALGWVSEYPSEATRPSTMTAINHHFRRRRTAR